MNKISAVFLLFGSVVYAQTKTPNLSSTKSSPLSTKQPPAATLSEAINNGTYLFQFADPNNKWRCYVTGYINDDPKNALTTSVSSFTVNCVMPHEVKELKKAGATK